jgi:hypothetical protein
MDGWFLHVNESKNANAYIPANAKYHYYKNKRTVCGKGMDTNYYETNIDNEEILKNPSIACKKCYKDWLHQRYLESQNLKEK